MPPKAKLINLVEDLKSSYQFSKTNDCPGCQCPLFHVYITPGLLSVDMGSNIVQANSEPSFDIQEVVCQNCGKSLELK